MSEERHQLLELARSYRRSQILLTCVELEIFDILSHNPSNASNVASLCGADSRGVELLLNAATALGWLQKREGLFSNSPIAQRHLTSAWIGRFL